MNKNERYNNNNKLPFVTNEMFYVFKRFFFCLFLIQNAFKGLHKLIVVIAPYNMTNIAVRGGCVIWYWFFGIENIDLV